MQAVFKRYEMKYILTNAQYFAMLQAMQAHMAQDNYGRHTIHNIYYDTQDYLLIRRSLEKPCYKEKLRVRSYGDATANSTVFVELKKKYDGVVYKRRMDMSQSQALAMVAQKSHTTANTQIGREIDYFIQHYGNLQPMAGITYEREAFYGLVDSDFRITFDHNLGLHSHDTALQSTKQMLPILPHGMVVLEVKTAMGLPFWLLNFFHEQNIVKTSFSKYGTAYQKYILNQPKGGNHIVA